LVIVTLSFFEVMSSLSGEMLSKTRVLGYFLKGWPRKN